MVPPSQPPLSASAELISGLPPELAVGDGTALFCDGTLDLGGARPDSLSLVAGGREHPVTGHGASAPGRAGSGDYWWGFLPFPTLADPRAQVDVALRARSRAGSAELPLGSIELRDRRPRVASEPVGRAVEAAGSEGDGPLIAVAMAAYEPDEALLRRQLESIREQTHRRFVCLISDDASSPAKRRLLAEAAERDRRFVVSAADRNRGFYENFERALRMVPPEAELVALSDQDDRWRPEKLERLAAAIEGDVTLAYSDMRLVDPGGRELAPTYWSHRRNNFEDFGSLIVANTVTGAASMFRADLLPTILPFPPRHSNLFHDHWIAQIAMALGRIAYLDEPLYDYTQHEGAALGHSAAGGSGRYNRPAPQRMLAALANLREQGWRPAWRAPYFNVYCRVALTTRIMWMRCGERMSPERRRELERLGIEQPRLGWLVRRGLRDLGGLTETIGRERVMLLGLGWRASTTLRSRAARRH